MAIQIIGNGGTVAEVDSNRNQYITSGERGYAAGGEYVTSGFTSALVAAALAANTMLMSARFAVGSARKAYITRLRVMFSVITPGANGGVPGVLSLVRFTAQTPTGGTARTAAKKNASHPSNSDMTDIRDSNAALTGTAPTFGDIVGATLIPTFPELTSGAVNGGFEWIFEPMSEPVVLAAGDGVALRTQVAGPATTTWGYSYTMHWYEK